MPVNNPGQCINQCEKTERPATQDRPSVSEKTYERSIFQPEETICHVKICWCDMAGKSHEETRCLGTLIEEKSLSSTHCSSTLIHYIIRSTFLHDLEDKLIHQSHCEKESRIS
ncbi:hypothetical protein CHS0354_014513 [Potamilus streckersoni]|uniref:Uncharacterized protein n=1 Tax=Potamilus streckersoni TaxID=2493646 RepID=A0AAE0SAG1_9BIVA|nr:hypothetical protein CHS0354_014513 [Potamilus streckersoni]